MKVYVLKVFLLLVLVVVVCVFPANALTYTYDLEFQHEIFSISNMSPPIVIEYNVTAPWITRTGINRAGYAFIQSYYDEWAHCSIQVYNSQGLVLDEGFNDRYDTRVNQRYVLYVRGPYRFDIYGRQMGLNLSVNGRL
jgi:hypothetical protein